MSDTGITIKAVNRTTYFVVTHSPNYAFTVGMCNDETYLPEYLVKQICDKINAPDIEKMIYNGITNLKGIIYSFGYSERVDAQLDGLLELRQVIQQAKGGVALDKS